MISIDVCDNCRKRICDSGTGLWSRGKDYLKKLLVKDRLMCVLPGDYLFMGPKSKVPERCPYKFEHAVSVAKESK